MPDWRGWERPLGRRGEQLRQIVGQIVGHFVYMARGRNQNEPLSQTRRQPSMPGPLCQDERDASPVRGRGARMGCTVRQDHVTLALAGLRIGLVAMVADQSLRVGLRQPFCLPRFLPSKGRNSDSGVTNVRNVSSPHWRRWLGVESRYVVPFTSFAENEILPDGSRPPVWSPSTKAARSRSSPASGLVGPQCGRSRRARRQTISCLSDDGAKRDRGAHSRQGHARHSDDARGD